MSTSAPRDNRRNLLRDGHSTQGLELVERYFDKLSALSLSMEVEAALLMPRLKTALDAVDSFNITASE